MNALEVKADDLADVLIVALTDWQHHKLVCQVCKLPGRDYCQAGVELHRKAVQAQADLGQAQADVIAAQKAKKPRRVNKHEELTRAVEAAMAVVARQHYTSLEAIKAGNGPRMPEWFYDLEGAVDEYGYPGGGR